MNKSLLNLIFVGLLATASSTALAGSVSGLTTFSSGTPALASEVNGNFTAVKTAVDDNDGRTTTNATDIGTNATDIGTNATDIGTNATDIGTNATDIGTNAADIATLQADACPSDMVPVGSICVDIYEASVWDAATGGTQLTGASQTVGGIACSVTGDDCVAGGANETYARSVTGVEPAYDVSFYQAAVACANVGKRLPTIAEWQMAAAGTPAGNGVVAADCNNVTGGGGSMRNTGEPASCVSAAGAYDMVGNVYELTSSVTWVLGAFQTDDTASLNSAYVTALGDDYQENGTTHNAQTAYITETNNAGNYTTGFRCVK